MTRAQKISRWLLVLAPVLLALIIFPNFAQAQLFDIFNIGFYVIGKIFFGITWIISMIGGIAIALVAWILGFVLQISTNIASSPPVKIGFPITLAFANLIFVLSIIVIAVATMVRFQSYGVKQALWRLIVIAMLVNFGLVISSAILGFSDSLATYFLAGVDPASSVGGATNGLSSFNNFASALAGAFNPQHWTNPFKANTLSLDDSYGAMSQIGGGIGGLVMPIASMFFAIFAIVFIVVTLGSLVVMLIIRYVKLGYLLIILPIAWAGFIFPQSKKYWSNWWNSFLSNAFFTPIVLFFLWLTMQVAMAMGDQQTYSIGLYQSPSNPVWAGLSNGFTNLLMPLVSGFLQLSVLLGLMMGGLIAAKNFGFGIADTAQKLALTPVKALGSWSKRKGMRAATALPRGIAQGSAYKNMAARLQEPGRNRLVQRLGGLMQGGQVASAQADIKEAEAKMAGMNTDQILNYIHRTKEGTVEQALAMKKIADAGKISQLLNAEKYFAHSSDPANPTKNQAVFKKLGMESDWKKARNESGLTGLDNVDATGAVANLADFAKGMQKSTVENQADFFKDHDKPEDKIFEMQQGGPGDARLRSIRDNVAQAIVSGEFTGSNRSGLFREVLKSPEQVKNMRSSIQKALSATPGLAGHTNIAALAAAMTASSDPKLVNLGNWLTTTPAREMGVDSLFI